MKITDYVCPKCFNQIENCVCKYQPYSLIWIDEQLQYAIKILNQKGYITGSCCEGHFEDYKKRIFIAFVNSINSCPNDWKLNHNLIYYDIKTNDNLEFEQMQKEEIEKLNKWVDEIESLN